MIRSISLFLFALFLGRDLCAQYWQQELNYRIDVSLNDTANSLTGFEKIEYINHSPDTLRYIWFHLWPNAYKNDRTAFSDQLLENGNTKFYFSGKEDKGYINQLDLKVEGITALTEDHPQHIDIIKLILPKPLQPGGRINISTPFHVRLPYNFSRGGHDGQSYQITQWFPKPAVYDAKGWHPITYLDQGEFYSDYGSFDVSITVPSNYVVAATGELQNEKEKKWLGGTRLTYEWTPARKKEMVNGQLKWSKESFPPTERTLKTLRYKQDLIHDFAWFADKRFIVQTDTCRLPSGKVIQVYSFFTPAYKEIWRNAVLFTKRAVRSYSEWVGEYPYSSVKVVQGPESFGGGMEYPTITVLSPTNNAKDLDITIAHEVGHNWFFGILGTNERDYPWMDEGINSYYEHRYLRQYYQEEPVMEKLNFETLAAIKKDQPISTPSERFSAKNYDLVAYYKTSAWLKELEVSLGLTHFDKAMQDYFNQWKFKHPYPSDMQAALQNSSKMDLSGAFDQLNKKGPLNSQITKGSKFVFLLDRRALKNYGKQPSRQLYTIGPAIGANYYDKLMAGIFLTNIKIAPAPFQFLLAPVYGVGSKKFGGTGIAWYSMYPDHGTFQKIELGLNGSIFTINELSQLAGPTLFPQIRKLVPGVKMTLREKDARSTRNRFIQFRSFQMNEDGVRFYRDTIISGLDTNVVNSLKLVDGKYTINQLQLVIENNRALYPYRAELKLEQGKDFFRTGLTGTYFFNYPRSGGLDLRFFAGKFIYRGAKTQSRRFATERYHINLTGANGHEDYTYSDYFVGRNEFEKMPSQQIMIRDGAFKIRTDLLASKVGKTDDWLMAVNLNTTIPDAINPLNILPFKVPLKLFLDIGSISEGWKPEAESDRFLYDFGLQLSLAKGVVNVYMPLLYSSVFKEYVQSTLDPKKKFWQKMSFSIDISNLNLKKLDPSIIY